jgi:hypothetical protein
VSLASHTVLALALLLSAVGCSNDSSDGGEVDVTFDGVSCIVSPETVSTGGRGFLVSNSSDERVVLYVASIEEGHDFQELLDLQVAVGGSPNYWSPKPAWLTYEKASPEHIPDRAELADNQSSQGFVMTEGTDAVYLYGVSPNRLWFCGPLEVTSTN